MLINYPIDNLTNASRQGNMPPLSPGYPQDPATQTVFNSPI